MHMESNRSDLVILGTSHHNTLSMIRSFGQEGLYTFLILYGQRKSYITHSKYLTGYQVVNTAEEAVDALKVMCEVSLSKPVVITCTDEVSMLLDVRYDEFINRCYFFNAGEKGRITNYMDKQRQCELAKISGFLTPWSIECLPENVPFKEIEYPCIIKPKESVYGGKKFFICDTQDDLEGSLHAFNPRYSVLVQQYIKGEYEIVIIGLTHNGNTYIPGFAKKHRDFKGGTTYSSIRAVSLLPQDIIEASNRIIKNISYEGLWGIECIYSNRVFYFIELNLRNDATTYSMAVAGVNLPLVYYYSIIGEDISTIVNRPVKELDSMVEYEDFNFVLKREVLLSDWLKEKKKCQCRYYYDKADPTPNRYKLKEYLIFLFKRFLRLL